VDSCSNILVFFDILKSFSKFLVYANKAFMFPSGEIKSVYYEESDDIKTIYFIPEGLYCEISVLFKNTIIQIPQDDDNILESFLNTGLTNIPAKHLQLIELVIKRDYGETTNYNFISSSESSAQFINNNLIDAACANNVLHIMKTMLLNCYTDILDNFITKAVAGDEADQINIKGVLSNGIRVRRSI
jgi:hypothetical protein